MEYICNICNKQYKSYQSIWNHNNKYHKEYCHPKLPFCHLEGENVTHDVIIYNKEEQLKKVIKCDKCNKIFKTRQSKSRHQKHVLLFL